MGPYPGGDRALRAGKTELGVHKSCLHATGWDLSEDQVLGTILGFAYPV